MKKSAKFWVIAALVVSAVVMTGCSNLISALAGKPVGTYVWEGTSNDGKYKVKEVYTFTGNNFTEEGYSEWLVGNMDEPWITIPGKFEVDGNEAVLTETATGLNVQHTLVTTDKWKTFTNKDNKDKVYKKKGL